MQVSSSVNPPSRDAATQPPFASYAQVVRMLMPLARKVVFHNAKGVSLWTSDGIEEAELSMQVQLLIERFIDNDPYEQHLLDRSELAEPVHVFPVRRANGELVGAFAVQFGNLPATAAYREYHTVQRVLNPLLEIIHHDWATEAAPTPPLNIVKREPVSAARPKPIAKKPQPTIIEPTAKSVKSAPEARAALPAALRRLLVNATATVESAFGAIVIPGQPFLLSHRQCADESDLSVSSAIDTVRSQLLRWMTIRNEPLIVNAHEQPQARFSSYKFLAWPVRIDTGPLLALLVLFRRRQDADFAHTDLDQLMQLTAQMPQAVLVKLQSMQPVPPPAVAKRRPKVSVATAAAAIPGPAPPQTTISIASIQSEDEAMLAAAAIVSKSPLPSLVERLRAALRDNAFDLHVQRITPLHSYDQPERFEVLLRMPDKHGLKLPATFLGTAEANGLMPELDRWVVRQLLRTLHRERSLGHSNRREFCINLSEASLLNDGFAELLMTDLAKSPGLCRQLVFEVSEHIAVKHPEAFSALGARLHKVGCRIALDNCRIGLGIFDLLPRWPVSCIKIDGALIRQMGTNTHVDTLVRTMAHMAEERGIESVAEQVESERMCRALIGTGLDFAQGFHLELPEPLLKQLA
jgi:EAL domain-containing protein (putative c-di-GMP-specific phosphodiesterase class I)